MQYLYDSLGRLTSAATLGPDWGQAYGYDGWGNLLAKAVTKGTATTLNVAVDPATNRILSGPSYDANGNVTNLPGVGTIAYDGRNRQVGPSTIPVRGYDASNRLIWRKVDDYMVDVDFHLPTGEKLGTYRTFVHVRYTTYDPDNPTCAPWVTGRHCIAFARLTEHLYFSGRQIKTEGSTTAWVQQDRLGSAVTHLPYGDERTATANDRLKFATYWRESSGVDYAQQRYYSSTYGRFLSADPYRASAAITNPQSWNRYSYVENDPINFTDPDGLAKCYAVSYVTDGSSRRANIQCVSEGRTKYLYDKWIPVGLGPIDDAFHDQVVADAERTFGAELDQAELADLSAEVPEFADAYAGTIRVTAPLIQKILEKWGPVIGMAIGTILAKARGETDPVKWNIWQETEKDESGKCKRPSPLYKWRDEGNAHGSTAGFHWHWMDPHLVLPAICRWWVGRGDGAFDPGPEWIELPGTYKP